MTITVIFSPSGRGKAKCKADENFPNGKIIEISKDNNAHKIALPYPAPECGVWILKCETCNFAVGVTAAGRKDDPKQVNFICRCKLN
jgi:hypothetical protein